MSGAIGYYVHHVGRGHLHRATALATHLAATGGPAVTGLSSLPRPADWPGEWVQLPRDDDGPADALSGTTARATLHWAPLHHDGLRERTAAISAWIAAARPRAVVVDLSVEVGLLVRLHGVPVVAVVLPGRRDDPAHLLGLENADELVAFWPAEAHGMLQGVPPSVRDRLHTVGALSRFATGAPEPRPASLGGPRHAVLLVGSGGHRAIAPVDGDGWRWTTLGAGPGGWVADPLAILRTADVVVTHAGQNAVAETAALRLPAVVVPQDRPHEEQRTTAAVLREGPWPALVLDDWPRGPAATPALDEAAALDGRRWAEWCDGRAVERFADVVRGAA
ncbi:glycosyltransferase [Nocardioides litoris]|uniref:glycosyltransferase n=1 Tax=Nocardioides litoris TaxID=1926648 RepID=UPI001122ECA6|nr:glycosyltransferase [Nocardioides litoris]